MREQTPAIRTEAARLLTHLEAGGGRIDVADPRIGWRPVTMAGLPDWWPAAAAPTWAAFQPPAPRTAGTSWPRIVPGRPAAAGTCTAAPLPGQALLAAALDHRLQHRPVTTMARTRFGTVLDVTSTHLTSQFVYLFGAWEPHLTHWLTRRIRPSDTGIDVGANIGYFTPLAAHLTGPAGHVVAIEPAPAFCQAIADAVHAGGTRGVLTRAGAAFYQPDPDNLGSTSMLARAIHRHAR